MKTVLKQLLEEMKSRVSANLTLVRENENDVRRLLLRKDSYEKAYNLQLHFKNNKSILSENMDYLELQLKIIKLMNKYRNSEVMKSSLESLLLKVPSNIDYFKETIEGKLLFNEYHPNFQDNAFIYKLMSHYLNLEEYTECQRLDTILKEREK